jgi:hypothetical protein
LAINDFTISRQGDTFYTWHGAVDDETVIPLSPIPMKQGDTTVLSISYRYTLIDRIRLGMKMRYFYDEKNRWIFGSE